MIWLVASAWAAEVYESDTVSLDLGGDVKSFFIASFPYEHLLMPDTNGQGILDGRGKLAFRYRELLDLEAHYTLTALAPGQSSTSLVSTGVGLGAPQAVNLTWVPVSGDLTVRGRVDRLSLGLSVPSFDLRVGRQPISFGKGYFFTPMDLVNPFSPATVDGQYKPGIDAVRADVYLGWATQITLAAAYAGDWDARGLVFAAYGQTTVGVWDLGLFAGYVRAEPVLGVAAVGSAGPLGLRTEATLTVPEDASVFVRAVAGADWRPFEDSSLTAEIYLQTLGAASPDDYLALAQEPRFGRGEVWLLGRAYAGLSWAQQITPTFAANLASFINLTDASAFVAPSIAWSVAGNAEVGAGGYIGVGERPGDVAEEDQAALIAGDLSVIPIGSEFGLLPTTIFVRISTYF